MRGPRRHRMVAIVLVAGVGAIPAAGTLAGTAQATEPSVRPTPTIPQREVVAAQRRCAGKDLLLRDRRSGGALTLGPASGPGRVVPLPEGDATRFALECQDGYIVELDGRARTSVADRGNLTEALSDLREEQAAELAAIAALAPDVEVVSRFDTLFHGLHVRLSVEEAGRLRAAGYHVWENGQVRATVAESVPLINADDVWIHGGGPLGANGAPGSTGRGVAIAVLDTGVDYRHPDLGGCPAVQPHNAGPLPCKVVSGYDVVNGDPDPMDDHGHGTHVASIAAGNGVLRGVAPDAHVHAYKVLDEHGVGTVADVLAGLELAVDPNRDGDVSDAADVINLSLAGTGPPDHPLSVAADNAVALGSVVVAAAGNVNGLTASAGTIGTPGTSRRAITVGASTKDDRLASFSAQGPVIWDGQAILKPDLVAPGTDICAARGGPFDPTRACLGPAHVALSGTSMAAPHVAGTAALLLQAHPALTPERIKGAMTGSAARLRTEQSVAAAGAGRIDALAAVRTGADGPVAVLDPVAQEGALRRISGTVSAADLESWTLSYSLYGGGSHSNIYWKELARSSEPPAGPTLFELPEGRLPDGRYILRLVVEDAMGRRAVDHGFVEIEKLSFAHPLPNDILRGGDLVEVRVHAEQTAAGGGLTVEFGRDWNPSSWSALASDGVRRFRWNTAGLERGWYTLRVTARAGDVVEREQIAVALDPALAPGWPLRVPVEMGCEPFAPPCPLLTGWADPVVEDLDGDGVREIVFTRFAEIPELRAYAPDGTLLWSTRIGSTPGSGIAFSGLDYLHPPVVDDLDGDGRKEVVIFNTIDSSIYVIDASGRIRNVWPVQTGAQIVHLPRLALADVNADGSRELVVSLMTFASDSGDRPRIVVVNTRNGAEIADWFVTTASRRTYSFIGVDYSYAPAVADLDGDPQLEIVAAESIASEIHAFEPDGTEIRRGGWPIRAGTGQEYFPIVTGDLDADGDNEVVAGLSRGLALTTLWAVHGDGTPLGGWPQTHDRVTSGPSLADLAGDPGLEIVLPMMGQALVLDRDGRPVGGWPQPMPGTAPSTAVVGDVDGRDGADVLVHSASSTVGSVLGWSATGASLPGFGMPVEQSGKAPVLLTEVGGRVAVIATSDSDSFWPYPEKVVTKDRVSVHLWTLESPYSADRMPWPTFQRDARRTGSSA